ncbi:hypothetical protein ACIQJX_05005, partial [Streptomyces griseoviridis]
MPDDLSDAAFLDRTADTLARLPGVRAVALGGSRAEGTARDDSDWDLRACRLDHAASRGSGHAHLRRCRRLPTLRVDALLRLAAARVL